MPDWFKEGGFPMFFILAFGGLAIATAFVYAIRPRKERGPDEDDRADGPVCLCCHDAPATRRKLAAI